MLRNKSAGKKIQKIPPGKNHAGNPPPLPRTTFCQKEYLLKKSTEKTFTRKKTYHCENRKKLVVGYFDALHGDKISS